MYRSGYFAAGELSNPSKLTAMEAKKTKKADLESKKTLFFQAGLATVLALLLIAFEWTTREVNTSSLGELQEIVTEEEIIPITRPEEILPPPPPPPPMVSEAFDIVEDDVEIDDELFIEDAEARADTRIDFTHIIIQAEEEEAEDDVFIMVEDMPDFQGGGQEAFRRWIMSNLKYPQIAAENGIQGTVLIRFIVNTDGSVSDVTVFRGVDRSLDNEAMRVISSSPRWTPGRQRGRPVRVAFHFPVRFQLE